MTERKLPLRDVSDPAVIKDIIAQLERDLPRLKRELAELEKAKRVTRRMLDMEITI